ncbi:NnrS family protein [Notoacmeibacter ruber]|uniref:NnrS family protein n=1 Tax=Notoacmeibacter ruber TaxID=2670375 RepID=A0A3L7JCZ7_9HYPH|nr:NnrS family protein [Notoacmeibacter ruber]RLQ88543.1 NnrS family protein [Notoacmeibacter ruber]
MHVLKSGARASARYADTPAILRQGFRIFFLSAALWAVLVMALFVLTLSGFDVLQTAFTPVDWHIHELLFGYTGAVIAGFLLTAVPNWTKRLPVAGGRLLFLFLLWLIGRVAVGTSAFIGGWVAAFADLLFPAYLIFVIARELIAGKNYRNLRVLVLCTFFAAANLAFHVEVALSGTSDYSRRGGIAVILVLIMLIGGRIIPSFTRNWLVQRKSSSLPVPFGRYDGATIAVSAMALLVWTGLPDHAATAFILGLASVLNMFRLYRWRGWKTGREGLLIILHLAYAFIPLGLLAVAFSIVTPDLVPPTGSLHLLTAGAIGMMTMAVMTRASLGHTGQKLHADGPILSIYAALAASVLLRFDYAIAPDPLILTLSGSLWIAAFLLFLLRYGSMAVR